MTTTAQINAAPTPVSAREERALLRRRLNEARERVDEYRAKIDALEQAGRNLFESAKRCGVDLESYASRRAERAI